MSEVQEQLKEEIFDLIYEKKYGKIPLVDIFLKDKKTALKIMMQKEISEHTKHFFNIYEKKLDAINENNSIEYFRNLQIEKIIEDYSYKFENNLLPKIEEQEKEFKFSRDVKNKKHEVYKNIQFEYGIIKRNGTVKCDNCGKEVNRITRINIKGKEKLCCLECVFFVIENAKEKNSKKVKQNTPKILQELVKNTAQRKITWTIKQGSDKGVMITRFVPCNNNLE